ncbi:hypothetical protein F2Q69_00038085 [Brassica cretica]|uniref:Uncharacterized protein n=1 Tax=Brassica cretica TaxID=69181 RepID=A0A8S9SGI2_BRACR|nr:hypothetical protein F2Q69_00038085 [Brassica cretica]
MKSAWKIPGIVSDLNPPSFTSSEPPPPHPDPPDPPDPASPLSPAQFPPLSSATVTGSKSCSSRKSGPQIPSLPFTAVCTQQQTNCTAGVFPASKSQHQTESGDIVSSGSETTTVVLRHSFHSWLVVLDRILIRDRLHENKYRSPDAIFRTIDHQLRNKIQSFRDVDPILTSKMMQTFENGKGSPLHLPSRSRLNQLLYR